MPQPAGALTVDVSADHLSYEIRNASNTVVASQLVADTSEIRDHGSLSASNSLTLNLANELTQPTAVSYSGQNASQGTIVITSGVGEVLPVAISQFNAATDEIIDELDVPSRSFVFTDNDSAAENVSLAAGSSGGTMESAIDQRGAGLFRRPHHVSLHQRGGRAGRYHFA